MLFNQGYLFSINATINEGPGKKKIYIYIYIYIYIKLA